MNLFLKRKEIISFLKNKNFFDGTEKAVWANINGVQGDMVVLVANGFGFLTLPITAMGKIQGDIIVISHEEISAISFKKRILTYELTIKDIENVVLRFRINKRMLGYSEQNSELRQLIEMCK